MFRPSNKLPQASTMWQGSGHSFIKETKKPLVAFLWNNRDLAETERIIEKLAKRSNATSCFTCFFHVLCPTRVSFQLYKGIGHVFYFLTKVKLPCVTSKPLTKYCGEVPLARSDNFCNA